MLTGYPIRLWLLVVALAVLVAGGARAAEDSDQTVCQIAGAEAERQAALPTGLLMAIGLVESGRRDPATGHVAPWPWTINTNGAGAFFNSLQEAVAATRARQSQGVASIDVGCFQINLLAHPDAFDSLETAFDPRANAAYAARFLTTLHDRTGSWESAIAAYHSATASRGGPYRDSVLARWTGGSVQAVVAAVMRAVVWSPSAGLHIWTPSAVGSAPTSISIRMPMNAPAPALPTVVSPNGH